MIMHCISEGTESNSLENVRGINFPTEAIWVEILGPEGYLKVRVYYHMGMQVD